MHLFYTKPSLIHFSSMGAKSQLQRFVHPLSEVIAILSVSFMRARLGREAVGLNNTSELAA